MNIIKTDMHACGDERSVSKMFSQLRDALLWNQPEEVEKFAKNAMNKGIQVIIAAAGMAAHLPGVIASMTQIPVIGVPIKASLDGLDALLAIVQMPPGIPVATVGIDGAQNAGILAAQILATADNELAARLREFKAGLKKKIVKANEELKEVKYEFKTN